MTDAYAETDVWPNPPATPTPAPDRTESAPDASRVLGDVPTATDAREAIYERGRDPIEERDATIAALRAEVERLKRGGAELGRILERTLTDALNASGRHDAIEEDGDGDWGVVWETLAELRPRAERAEAERDALRAEMVSLAGKWQAQTPASLPAPSEIAAAYERGIKACTADLCTALASAAPAVSDGSNQRLACAYGGHQWVQGEGVAGVAYLRRCSACGSTHATGRAEWESLAPVSDDEFSTPTDCADCRSGKHSPDGEGATSEAERFTLSGRQASAFAARQWVEARGGHAHEGPVPPGSYPANEGPHGDGWHTMVYLPEGRRILACPGDTLTYESGHFDVVRGHGCTTEPEPRTSVDEALDAWESKDGRPAPSPRPDTADAEPRAEFGEEFCALSERVDGKRHTWRFDGDDPYIVCHWCDEVRDAHTGRVVREGNDPQDVLGDTTADDEGVR